MEDGLYKMNGERGNKTDKDKYSERKVKGGDTGGVRDGETRKRAVKKSLQPTPLNAIKEVIAIKWIAAISAASLRVSGAKLVMKR